MPPADSQSLFTAVAAAASAAAPTRALVAAVAADAEGLRAIPVWGSSPAFVSVVSTTKSSTRKVA